MGSFAADALGVVVKAACLFRTPIRPRPRDVDLLEVHVRALSTQNLRIGLHAKECFFRMLSTRDVNQNMFAWLHQVEPLTMNILKVGIADG